MPRRPTTEPESEDEPLCPECGEDARAPKCLWELGRDYPRHPVRKAWVAKRAAVLPRQEERP
jgi:hypothetical protein